MSMLNLRAIWIGFLADIGSTFLFTAALTIALFDPGSAELPPAACLEGSCFLDAFMLAMGLALTAVGGFVAARMAPGREATHAAGVGVLSLMASMLLCAPGAGPDWYLALGLGMTFPAALFGGVVATLTRLREF